MLETILLQRAKSGDLFLDMPGWPTHAEIPHASIAREHPMIRLRDGHIDFRMHNGRAVYRIDDERLGVYSTTCVYSELL